MNIFNRSRALLCLVIAVSPALGWSEAKREERYENLELFQKILHFVEQNYVDPVTNKRLLHGAIKGMLNELDPHSNFMNAEAFKDMKNDTSGKYAGVGLEVEMKDNFITVLAPIEGTPAYKAGIVPGDRITKINGQSTRGMTLIDAVSGMRGKKGTDLSLSIFRTGAPKTLEYKLKREDIKVASVKSEMIEPGFVYVRLASFTESAAADIRKAIDQNEKKEKLRGLVLDLRSNPGGLLDQAVDVTSLFMDEGVVVSTIGREKDKKEIKNARPGMARKYLAVAVLVNSSSASASEIVAGALQDNHRAIIMGQPTFGKGSVQSVIDLGNELGLKLTIARYYTPSGRSIQEKGVQPDILLDDFDPKLLEEAKRTQASMREKDLRGHIANTDESDSTSEAAMEELANLDAKRPSDKGAKNDYQVREAVNYLKSFEIFKKLSSADGRPTAISAKQ